MSNPRGLKTRALHKNFNRTKRCNGAVSEMDLYEDDEDPLIQELIRLKRGYRKMRLDYNKYRDESDKEISKQKLVHIKYFTEFEYIIVIFNRTFELINNETI